MNAKTLLNPFCALLLANLPFIATAQVIITSINPEHGPVGAIVTIHGSRFLPAASSNTVWFGPVRAEVTEVNNAYLKVKVPAGAAYSDITVVTGGLSTASPKPFNPTFDNGGYDALNTLSFAGASAINNGGGTNPTDIYSADLDGDGKADIAVANFSAGTVSVYKNTSVNGVISYALAKTIATGVNPWYITGGDLNRDGMVDLVVTNSGSHNISILKNISTPGNIIFDAKLDYNAGKDPKDAIVCDFNKDGMPDIAVSNYGASTVTILKNTGLFFSMIFQNAGTYGTGPAPFGIAAGDIDGDGKTDIVVSNAGNASVSVLKNNCSGQTFAFAGAVNFGTGDWPQAITVGDINQDGKPDIVTHNLFSNTISILKNTGNGNIAFAAKADFSTGGVGYSIAISDINGDNKPDIVVAGNSNIDIFRNTTHLNSLSFDQRTSYNAGGRYISSVTSVDADGDGRPDIIAVDETSNTVLLLKNQINLPFITSFSPQAGNALTKITITGNNFSNATAVTVGGITVPWFQVVNATTILAVPGHAASGKIEVINPAGKGEKAGFSFTPYCFAGSNNVINKVTDVRINSFNYTGLPVSSSYTNYLNQRTTISPGNQSFMAINFANSLADQNVSVFIDFNKDGDFDDPGENILNAGPKSDKLVTGYLNVLPTADSGINIMRIRLTNTGTGSNTTACGQSASGQVIDLGVYISIPPPVITRLSYTTGVVNKEIQITGENLLGASSVTLGGVPATIVSVHVPGDYMTCKVGAGATGDVVVKTPGGTATLKNGFTYSAPKINIVSPLEAKAGTRVTISGEFFDLASNVTFGGVPAKSFTGNNHTITAYVGAGHSGDVAVTTPGGTVKFAGFVYQSPVISSFTPAAAAEGSVIVIKGIHFRSGDNANASHVTFGGVNARSFTVVNDTMITAVVDKGTTGAVAVTVAGVTASRNGFNFVPTPAVISFSPTIGTVGTVITIAGANFSHVTAVTVAGIPVKSFHHVSDNVITAIVSYDPKTGLGNGHSGSVIVTSAGLPLNAGNFTFTNYCPAGTVNLEGLKISKLIVDNFNNEGSSNAGYENFLGLTIPVHVGVNTATVLTSRPDEIAHIAVYADFNKDGDFEDPNETVFVSPAGTSPFSFNLVVPATAVAGETRLRVAVYGQTNTKAASACGQVQDQVEDYTLAIPVIPPTVITSFSPGQAGGDSTVVIYGSGFIGATQVSFGGVPAKSFRVHSPAEIIAVVGVGASGDVSVTAANTTKLAGFTYINPPAPIITSFLPKTAGKGSIVQITGTGFNWVTSLMFGGKLATSFIIQSPTSISAVVADGSTGDVTVASHTGSATANGFTYLNYCDASGTYTVLNHEKIQSVTIGSFTNDTRQYYSYPYFNFNNPVVHLRIGENAMDVPITDGNSYAQLAVYIDFNQDGDFDDANETVYVSENPVNRFVFNFNVPATALPGATRMRVRVASQKYAPAEACGTNPYGQVQDYTVIIPQQPVPVIESFTPAAGNGQTVTITGIHLAGTSAVSFGGVPAQSFQVYSATHVTAVVAGGGSGKVSLTTPGGMAALDGFTYTNQLTAKAGAETGNLMVSQLAVSAMPNPTKTAFTLHVSGDNKPVEVRVTDMAGKVLYHERGTANRNYIFGNNFAQGMYIAEVLQGDQVKTIKLIKAR